MLRATPHYTPTNVEEECIDIPVSIVIPCLNEEESIEQRFECLTDLESTVTGYAFHCIIVDDGSTDNSKARLLDLFGPLPNFELMEHGENLGIAAAISTGIHGCDRDVVTRRPG